MVYQRKRQNRLGYRVISWVMVCILLLTVVLGFASSIKASGPTLVYVSTPGSSVSMGTSFTVDIVVEPNNAIAGVQFDLTFDPSLVTAESIQAGELLAQNGADSYLFSGNIDNELGSITGVTGMVIGPGQTVSTTGTFATITFSAGTSQGICALSLSNVMVGDMNGQSVDTIVTNGEILIDSYDPDIIQNTVGYWDFNENSGFIANNSSGYGNNGTLMNVPLWTAGRSSSALRFDGDNDYVDCGNDPVLNITDEITIETWIHPAATGEGTTNASPVSKAEAGVDWSWQLRYNAPDGGHMGFQFNGYPEGSTWVSVNESLTHGEWYHIVGVYDGTNIICYLNGTETDRDQISGITGGNSKLFIGHDGWGNVFNGSIDQVRIWNKALSQDEVQSLYGQL